MRHNVSGFSSNIEINDSFNGNYDDGYGFGKGLNSFSFA